MSIGVRCFAMNRRIAILLGSCAFFSCAQQAPLKVPPPTTALPPSEQPNVNARKGEPVVETLFGVKVADPFRWLEAGDSEDAKRWTDEQNARTRGAIDQIKAREEMKGKIREVLELGTVSAPRIREGKKGERKYFYTKRSGAQNQPVLYVRDGAFGKDRVLLDVPALSADGTTALDWWFPSWNGALVAWGKSEAGSEESVLHVREVATGKDLEERIDRTRHASVAWLPDGKGFYYTRYPEKGTVPPGDEKYGSKVFFHTLGSDSKSDRLVFGEGRKKTDTPIVQISPNGRWLIVQVHEGWDKNELYLQDRQKGENAPFVEVAVGKQALFDPTPRDQKLYILTNDGSPKYRLVEADYANPTSSHWKDVIPEGEDVLNDVNITDEEIIATFLHEASSKVERFTKAGKKKGSIALPQIGSASVQAPLHGGEAFVGFSSYAYPPEVFRIDLTKNDPNARTTWEKVGASFSSKEIEVTRLYATSKDGTKVPMFVVSKGALKRDANNPTILYGYGGFNINQTPQFSARALSVVRQGGVWVTAILRGGGEFGEAWHRAGMLDKKQNVFDDFIACAEQLTQEKITSADHLAVMGGSNGGLLTSTVVTQRPELFRVALSLVPLTDMLRYHRFRIGRLWVSEYGDPDDAAQFATLYAYSPYHHVKEGVRYPSMLFTTAESDTRVDPMHAKKMAARLQAAQADSSHPILIRVETKAGHGAGKPISKVAEELADELAFVFHELGSVQ